MLKSQRRAFRWPNNFRARLYCPRVLRDIILLVLKDAHVMYSGVADKIQPYRIEIVVAGANLKTAYSYILENFHFYISNLSFSSNFCGAL